MRLKQSSHLVLGRVPQDLCDRVRSELINIQWASGRYQRTEITLNQGLVIEMPYHVTNFHVLDSASMLAQTVADLVSWIQDKHLGSRFLPIRCEIAALIPGSRLEIHRDQAWFHSHSRRLHVPLKTNDRCLHMSQIDGNDQVYHMNPDVLYELNNIDPHTAWNDGADNRIHVIIDFMPLDFFVQAVNNKIDFKATVPPGLYAEWSKDK